MHRRVVNNFDLKGSVSQTVILLKSHLKSGNGKIPHNGSVVFMLVEMSAVETKVIGNPSVRKHGLCC